MSRINQYEAESFDEYMINMIVDTVKSSLESENNFRKYNEEIKIGIKIIYYAYKLIKDKVTEGQLTYNVKFEYNVNNNNTIRELKIIGFLFCKILIPYIINKLEDKISNLEQNSLKIKILKFLIKLFDLLLKFGDLFNFILFLINNKFPTIWHRLFNINYVILDPNRQGQLSFNFLMKKIIWNQLSKIILFFFNFTLGKKGLQSIFSQLANAITEDNNRNIENEISLELCQICHNSITMKFKLDLCQHIFCHYCINLHKMKGNDLCPM